MNNVVRNGALALLGTLTIAGIAATLALDQAWDRQSARRDKEEVARITDKMSPLCVGRFVIDLPEEARLELSSRRIDGLSVVTYSENDDDFEVRLERREIQNKAIPDRFGGNKNLELVQEVTNDTGIAGKVFVHGRTVTEGTRTRGLELERYRHESVAVEALMHGSGISVDVGADKYDPDQVNNFVRLATRLVANPANTVPTEPGFCVDRAYFRDPPTDDLHDEIEVRATLPSHPDLEFRLTIRSGATSGDGGLLKRIAESNIPRSEAEKVGIYDFRIAARVIGSLIGDEVATRWEKETGGSSYRFRWEVYGTVDDALNPHVSFEMEAGEDYHSPVPSSLSQRAASALWEKVLSSIRLHPAHRQRIAQVHTPLTPVRSEAKLR